MTRRREIDGHLQTLGELREILGSMRTLSWLELRKLGRLQENQRGLTEMVGNVAEDFRAAFPDVLPDTGDLRPLIVVLGSQRGFVGDHNEQLIDALPADTPLIAVGHRLYRRLEGDTRLRAGLDGPDVAEQCDAVLSLLMEAIADEEMERGPHAIDVLHHENERGLTRRSVFPPHREPGPVPARGYAPLLNLSPRAFFLELLDHYLINVLREALLTALVSENQQRMQHLGTAVDRMDERLGELDRKRQQLRQEEITEEIEVILLGADALSHPFPTRSPRPHAPRRAAGGRPPRPPAPRAGTGS